MRKLPILAVLVGAAVFTAVWRATADALTTGWLVSATLVLPGPLAACASGPR